MMGGHVFAFMGCSIRFSGHIWHKLNDTRVPCGSLHHINAPFTATRRGTLNKTVGWHFNELKHGILNGTIRCHGLIGFALYMLNATTPLVEVLQRKDIYLGPVQTKNNTKVEASEKESK